MSNKVLILGASGRFGRHAAAAFQAAGWAVQTFRRDKDNLTDLAQDTDVIVNAWNPPYQRWATEVPSLTRTVIAAAKLNDATVILPGNVYVFGKHSPDLFGPETSHMAQNPLGRIRVDLEAAYRDAGVRTIVLRGGDYIDTEASGNWFDSVLIKSLNKGRVVYPGDPDIPHAWAYLPDLARAAVELANRRDKLDQFEDIAFPGYTLSGRDIARLLGTALGRPITLRRMNWLPVELLKPVWPMLRGLSEMRYLWNKPHRLDGALFNKILPNFVPTPPETALREAAGAINIHPDQSVARSATVLAK